MIIDYFFYELNLRYIPPSSFASFSPLKTVSRGISRTESIIFALVSVAREFMTSSVVK